MSWIIRIILVALVIAPAAGFAQRNKARKLPEKAYITTAKIEVQSGDLERYATAIALLDTLFMHYGPHAEGLHWMRKIVTDLVEKTAQLDQKAEYIKQMTAYIDSLHMCCGNKEIKKKYRKNCDDLIREGDSVRVFYWRTFYNAGVGQVDEIREAKNSLKDETDEESSAYYQGRLEALIDSCEWNMSMAIILDSVNSQPYIGLASAFKLAEEYSKANEWLIRGLEFAEVRTPLLIEVGYNYVQLEDYCTAIPHLKEAVDLRMAEAQTSDSVRAEVLRDSYNLSICYRNCQDYTGARDLYHRMLEIDPNSDNALTGLGRHHRQMASYASDSASMYRDQGDSASVAAWYAVRDTHFDSAATYVRQAFDIKTEDVAIAEELGIVMFVREDYEGAAEGFERAANLDPGNSANWTSLGDCYIKLQKFTDATSAYERVVEIEPDNKYALEQLQYLYHETKQPDKLQEVKAKLESL